jgi:hypothetical protein
VFKQLVGRKIDLESAESNVADLGACVHLR